MFYGGGATASGLGIWEGMTTLTMFDHVSLVVLGNYTNSATILFGRGVGAAGTANWHDVVLDEQMTDGNNLQVCYVNYDSFLWSGGDINIKIADAAATPRIFRLEATQGSLVENVASYRDPEKPTPAIYWWYLTPSDDANMHYVFKNFVFYGFDNQTDVTYHFRSTEGVVKVDLNNVGGNGITSLGYKITTGANNIEFYIDHMGKGVIANPVDATGVYLWDWGTGTIANNTIYTNWGSAKTIYVYGGTWASDGGASGQIVVDGTKVCSGTFSNEMLVLQPGDTILFGWQSAPTIVVIGQ